MKKQLSIYECINVLKYYHKGIPKNIYRIKRTTNLLLNKHMCNLYSKNRIYNVLLLYHFTFSKNKYLFNNTKRLALKGFHSTRNVSPTAYLSCI